MAQAEETSQIFPEAAGHGAVQEWLSPPEVLRDWRGGNTKGKASLYASSRSALMQRMAAFFKNSLECAGAKKLLSVKQKRLANKYWMMGLDSTLQKSFGIQGLKSFVATELVEPLHQGTARYCIAVSDLPEQLQLASPGRSFRSCLVGPDKRRR